MEKLAPKYSRENFGNICVMIHTAVDKHLQALAPEVKTNKTPKSNCVSKAYLAC